MTAAHPRPGPPRSHESAPSGETASTARLRRRAALAGALAALLAAACGLPSPPPPVPAPDAPHLEVGPTPAGPAVRAVADLPPRPYPPPEALLRPRVRVHPAAPREGDAVVLRVRTPASGEAPVAVEGRLGERPVHFHREGAAAWLGVGALPPGETGPRRLVLRYRFPDGRRVEEERLFLVAARTYPSSRLSVAPRYASPPPEVLDRIRRERELVAAVLERVTPEWRAAGGFRWPRPPTVTSPFGVRRTFNGRVQSRHWGVDLRGPAGAPVRAAAAGRVALVRPLYYAGNAVYLDHGLGVYTAYFHLSATRVHEGREVAAGEVLGEVGATGRVTGPHLHWSLYVNGVHLDARSLIGALSAPGTGAALAGTVSRAP